MKTIFSESTVDAVNFLCAPWARVARSIWLEPGVEVDLDLSEDKELTAEERIIAEVATSLFDNESSARLQAICALDDREYDRVLNAFKILRRSSELAEIHEGDFVRTITYKKILALAERRGIQTNLFEDIPFPGNMFIKELIPYCGEELKVLSIDEKGFELQVGDDEWFYPKEWISGKAR